MEATELFSRSLGDGSDVVMKVKLQELMMPQDQSNAFDFRKCTRFRTGEGEVSLSGRKEQLVLPILCFTCALVIL